MPNAKICLKEHLTVCKDGNRHCLYLSGSLMSIGINGVEIRLRKIGNGCDIQNLHPHMFKRTMVTRAINKGYANLTGSKTIGLYAD